MPRCSRSKQNAKAGDEESGPRLGVLVRYCFNASQNRTSILTFYNSKSPKAHASRPCPKIITCPLCFVINDLPLAALLRSVNPSPTENSCCDSTFRRTKASG